jgi:predicted NUDIX family NTP pyrophosphohydrolase
MARTRRRARLSAGILLYRRAPELEVLLVHPGGPFWRNRDIGAWMIPKGEVEADEQPDAAALREVEEELGHRPDGEPELLCRIRQSGGKLVEAYIVESDFDVTRLASNHFTMEYPPRSGEMRSFPEVDAAEWLSLDAARAKILPSQLPILDALEERLSSKG